MADVAKKFSGQFGIGWTGTSFWHYWCNHATRFTVIKDLVPLRDRFEAYGAHLNHSLWRDGTGARRSPNVLQIREIRLIFGIGTAV
jgi:hypothetical protein